LETAIYKVS